MILFRTDGNGIVSTGHIMRCLSVADAFRRAGKRCVFAAADEEPRELIASRGYEVLVLGTKYDGLEGEIETVRALLREKRPELVILDSYFVTEEYMRALDGICRLVYIDDLGAFPYPCRALVNYNAYGPCLDYEGLYAQSGGKRPLLCLGIQYVPLREEFRNAAAHAQPEEISDILVSTGGGDPEHIALEMVRILREERAGYRYHFVVGPLNRDADEILALAEGNGSVRVHRNVRDMKALMTMCGAAVSAAGSTLYELCACGVPTVTYVSADNQRMGAEAFQRLGLMKNVGDIRKIPEYGREILREAERLAADPSRRREVSGRMQRMVDGCGADRLVRRLLPLCEET